MFVARQKNVSPRFAGVAAALAVFAAFAIGAPAAQATTGPKQTNILGAIAYSFAHGTDLDPPGTNDWSCRPSAAHPRPVVLVEGTGANRYDDFAGISSPIASAGCCVFTFDYGDSDLGGAGRTALGKIRPFKALGEIRVSAQELAVFVDKVLSVTGAAQVDLVGHSQGGGIMPRTYLRWYGGANAADPSKNKVHALIGVAPSGHGASLSGLTTMLQTWGLYDSLRPVLGPAAYEQFPGSPLLTELNAGGDTEPGVSYTAIVTSHDEVVTPWRTGFLTAGPGATVTNITLQRGCPIDASDHLSIIYDPRVYALVLNALDPARHGPVPCTLRLPLA